MDEGRFYALLRFEEASLALKVALQLNLVDKLGNREVSHKVLQDEFGFTEQASRTFFSLLHVMGIFDQSEMGFRVSSTAASCLTSDPPTSRKPYLAMGSGEQVDSMIELLKGNLANDSLPLYAGEGEGTTVMDNEPIAREIALGLASRARNFAQPLAEAIATVAPLASSLADIGAGSPYVANACLNSLNDLETVLLVDRPNGMKFVREIIQGQNMDATRIHCHESDFFESVPQASVYLLSNTAHDWLVDEYARIINNIKQVMPEDGLICVHEPLLLTSWNSDTEWIHALWMACYAVTLLRLTLGKGTCYTLDEHFQIFEDGGFKPVGQPTPTSDGCTAMFFSPRRSS